MTAVATLWRRELTRFYRDRGRVIGALTPPIVFWFLIGSGLGSSFKLGELNFLQYFYSGTLVLIVLFTSIFSTISIIEDRREGFLQSVLVAPVSRLSIVLGKILGAATVGLLQGVVFLLFAPLLGLHISWLSFVALALCAIGLTGLGFCLAWKLDSTQGFHAVMNLFLIPMWMLSGGLFPAETAPRWLQIVISLNPVTYAVTALQLSLGQPASAGLGFSLGVLTAFAAGMVLLSVTVASQRDAR